jgi:riboflavin biosynthesis pyrimidine reductase
MLAEHGFIEEDPDRGNKRDRYWRVRGFSLQTSELLDDPEAVREMKATARRDLTVGGPTLAAEAFAAGLVDECHLFLAPVAVGGGNPALPQQRVNLDLLEERQFGNGMVYLRYRTATP